MRYNCTITKIVKTKVMHIYISTTKMEICCSQRVLERDWERLA